MRNILIIAISFFIFGITANAQTACPENLVCISREAALKALADSDENKALKAEVAVKNQAIEDFRKELNNMRIQFAEKSGENTALKQNSVSDRALIEILIKYARPKKIGLNIF